MVKSLPFKVDVAERQFEHIDSVSIIPQIVAPRRDVGLDHTPWVETQGFYRKCLRHSNFSYKCDCITHPRVRQESEFRADRARVSLLPG